MPKTKVEVYDKDQLIYPYIESDHVTFSNGMKVSEMLDQSISMPTVTHEDLSFKVGVGDQDVSNAIVDSSVSKMTIKGKTYQNILPEPSTHVLTNNKEMFKVNEGLDPNVEIVDGVSKSAILKGQTLNNIALTINNVIHKNAGIVVTKPSLYDMAKRYIVMFDVVEKPDTLYMKLEGATDGIWKCDLSSQKLINSVGRYYLISNVSSVQHKQIKLTNASSSSERCIVTNVNVIEYQNGMENWDIPYFEGMQSVKLPVLTTTGKNLIDKQTLQRGYIHESGGFQPNNTDCASDYIKILPNTKYTYKVFTNINYGMRFSFFNKSKSLVYRTNVISVSNGGYATYESPSNAYYVRVHSNNFDNIGFDTDVSLVMGDAPLTLYEPYKSNILSCNEEVELRGIGDIKDELDCLTGEVTERIGEYQITGEENWEFLPSRRRLQIPNPKFVPNIKCGAFACDKLQAKQMNDDSLHSTNGTYYIGYTSDNWLRIILDENLTSLEQGKEWLKANKPIIQYQLKTESIKTVDLSTSGNWEKTVLDGSERWILHNNSGDYVEFRCANMINNIHDSRLGFSDKFPVSTGGQYERIAIANGTTYITVKHNKAQSVEQLQSWLSQNPITVWYQTQTQQDSTQVKQPIFFKDGHIQLSSGADSSLIPTLDYQAKTSNSYVMDLMKANTRYTMKAKSASGTFTIDGTSYGAGTNGTFTTPTSMTNKLLVMSNKTNEEVMILEGDVVSKTIPYFKGIKSAFEGEDKIEVLSIGKNLLINNQRLQEEGVLYFTKGWSAVRLTTKAKKVKIVVKNKTGITGTKLSVKDDIESESNFMQLFEIDEVFTTIEMEYSLKNSNVISFCSYGSSTFDSGTFFDNYDIEVYTLDNMDETMVDYKSNNTKIQLLSSLQTVVENVHMTQGSLDNATGAELVDTACVRSDFIEVVEDTTIVFRNGGLDRMAHILAYDSEKRYVEKLGIVSSCSIPKDRGIKYVRIFMNMSNYDKLKISKSVKAYKGLASLPNGVHDEIVLDRENNKAKIIQRVGKVTYDGTDVWGAYTVHQNNVRIQTTLPNCVRRDTADFIYTICDKLPSVIWNHSWLQNYNLVTVNHANIHLQLSDTTMTKQQMLSWLTQNPITVYYELETPVITEIDLEGFPYIYKDGHIFLNSEIVPTTEIVYSVNQCQQISASNEDIIRHEKELTYLQKLIAQYVQVDYESALLSLKV